MTYLIKHKNTPIIEFEVMENTAVPRLHILWVTNETHLLPLDLKLSDEGLSQWIKHRTIPKNRAFVDSFLYKCGLNINRPMDIISVSKGLSLNDVYWVVTDDFHGLFENYNLYENKFSSILALIALTGYGSSVRSSLVSSPEFTTNGALPKCWRRINGKIYLYKGGVTGFSNSGFEPYSEFYASEIAKAMGVNAIEYRLSKWKGTLCSTCELFTDLNYSFVPIGNIITSGSMPAVREFYESMGQEFVDALNEMLVFDAIICNEDRHFNNFGVLVDNNSNTIVKPAPLFDHGNSLFHFVPLDSLESEEAFDEYAASRLPRTYDNFIDQAKSVMTDKNREQIRHLLTYQLKKNPRYNVSEQRYKLLSNQIQKRARLLLK